MSKKVLIFDCDGVLVDSEPIANRILAEELTRIGLTTSYEETIQWYMGKSDEDCLRQVTDRLGHAPPPDLMANYQLRTEHAFARELKAIDGVRTCLKELNGPKCVGSSGSHQKIRNSLRQTNLEHFFNGQIFSSADVKRGKPHPDLFLFAAEKMGASPDNCVVIEDSLPGVTAAAAAGMRVCGYAAMTPAEQLQAAGAETFTQMRDLPKLLPDFL